MRTTEKTNRLYFYTVFLATSACLFLFALVTIIVDPFFHYHAPLKGMSYQIYNERYQNDGISRNFEYNAIITGTSMTQNFKTSEFDKIFEVSSIKVPFSGAGYKEINQNLKRAFGSGHDIDIILRGLDYGSLLADKDWTRYEGYPTYLTNDNLFDDVRYILNKEVFLSNTLETIWYTQAGNATTSFDVYNNWNAAYTFGKEAVFKGYSPLEKSQTEYPLTEEEIEIMRENIQQNVTAIVKEYPQTMFYMFFTPYSIGWWEQLSVSGAISKQIDAEKYVIEELLRYPNIKIYSFFDNYEMICDLDNYKDVLHYGEWVNSWILQWMSEDKYLLTEENYIDYLEKNREFYMNYDYESLHGGD